MKRLLVGLAHVRRPKGGPGAVALKVIEWLGRARRRGMHLAIFPEGFLSGLVGHDYPEKETPDWGAVDRALDSVRAACRRLKIGAVLGTGVKEGKAVWNRSFLVDRAGRIAGVYEKTHLPLREGEFYRRGGRYPVFRFMGVPVGLLVCYDQRFPEPWRVLALKGAKIVFHVSCAGGRKGIWKRPVVEAHLRSRAAENGFFVLSVNRAERWASWISAAFDPSGRLLGRAPFGRETLVEVAVDPSKTKDLFLRERRTDLYGSPRPRPAAR